MEIENSWVFYYLSSVNNGNTKENYIDRIKPIADCNSINEFWEIYSHIKRPTELLENEELHFFKTNFMALWEEPNLINGLLCSIDILEEYIDSIWEHSLLNLVGEQLMEDIVGVVVSRKSLYRICFWIRPNSIDDTLFCENISTFLGFPPGTVINYRHNQMKSTNKHYQVQSRMKNQTRFHLGTKFNQK